MIVWQMLAALGMGAVLGAGGVSWWVAGWPGSRRPVRARVVSRGVEGPGQILNRLPPAPDPLTGLLRRTGAIGPEQVAVVGEDQPVRMTYVRGPVRGRDHE